MPNDATDPRSLLPLKPIVFDILVVLASEELHGWSLAKALRERAGGEAPILPGNLYRTLKAMLTQGLIEESGERPDPEEDDERRRYYRVSDFGRAVARAEARRLEEVLREARNAALVPERPGGR